MERNKRRKHSEQLNSSSALSSDGPEDAAVIGTDSSQVCSIEPKWAVDDEILCQWRDANPEIKYKATVIEVIKYADQPSYKVRFNEGKLKPREYPHSMALNAFSAVTPENEEIKAIAQYLKSEGLSKEVNSKTKKSPKQKADRGCRKESDENKSFTGISAPRKKVSSMNAARAEVMTNEEVEEEANDGKEKTAILTQRVKAPRKKLTSMNTTHVEPIPEAVEERSSEEDLPGAAGQQSPVPSEDVKGLRRKSASVSNHKHTRRFSKEEAGNGTEVAVIRPAVSQVLVESTKIGSMEEPANGTAAVRTGIQQMTFTDVSDTNDISNEVKSASQPVSAKNTSGRGRKRQIVNEQHAHKMDDNMDSADTSANGISQLAIIDEPESSKQKLGKRRRSNIDQASQPVAVDKNNELIAVPRPSMPLFAPEEEVQSAAPEPIVLPEKLRMVLEVDKRQAGEKSLPSIPARFTVEEILEEFCKLNSQEEKYRVFRKDLLDLFNSRFERDVISNFESPMHQDIRSNVGYYFYGLERFLPAHLKNDVNKQNQGPSEMSKMFGLPHLLRFLTKFHETIRRRKDKSANLLLCINDFVHFLDGFQHLYFDESKDYYPAALVYIKRAFSLNPLQYFY
ncbi:MRG domain-containing protein [Ditylenchus destructor]|nr:MRG domain-containing protein [Ditylenchus destructor]